MFTHLKKDYYSVNANISITPVKQQVAMLSGEDLEGMMLQALPNGTMITEAGEIVNAPATESPGYQTKMDGSGSPRRSVSPTNTIMVPPSLLMGQPPRYDEVYYPRTDKRMIRKYFAITFSLRWQLV